METRSQSKKRKQQEQQQSVNNQLRNWADLPTDLLLLFLQHLSLSIPDLLSFAAVCRPWRQAATISSSSIPPSRRPPLLLNPKLSFNGGISWLTPHKCHFKTLTNDDPKFYNSVLRSDNLAKRCIGSSYGCILIDLGDDRVMIADAFNGVEVVSSTIPSKFGVYNKFEFGVMMGKLSEEDCRVLLVGQNCTLWWKVRSGEWARELYLRSGQEVITLVVFEGMVYCMDVYYRVKVVDVDEVVSWKTLEMEFLNGKRPGPSFAKYLVECGGRILLVVFDASVSVDKFRIVVYRLDFEFLVWVKLENIGDWCLFVDVAGNCPIACEKPENWGGRNNCVYFVGPGDDNWSIYPLDGSEIDVNVRKPAISVTRAGLPRWPSPIWVQPSRLL